MEYGGHHLKYVAEAINHHQCERVVGYQFLIIGERVNEHPEAPVVGGDDQITLKCCLEIGANVDRAFGKLVIEEHVQVLPHRVGYVLC